MKKWGLWDAAKLYLLNPEHDGAIPHSEFFEALRDNPEHAAMLIDKTMSRNPWKTTDTIPLRVWYLRTHMEQTLASVEAKREVKQKSIDRAKRKAEELISGMPACDATGVENLSPEKRSELLGKGLRELSNESGVISFLRKSEIACRKIIAQELETEHLHEEVNRMSIVDLQTEMDKLQADAPVLRHVFQNNDPRSKGIRELIVGRLRKERLTSAL